MELHADPLGIGFAFGGVSPGTLHARGQLHEAHKVSYSIGLAGDYLLHVRLRQQALALPGSPFKLIVLPAAAHARSTRLQAEHLRGMVGLAEEDGVETLLRTADKMGNLCVAGGARVRLDTGEAQREEPQARGATSKVKAAQLAKADEKDSSSDVQTAVVDQDDGTYRLHFKSKFSGTFKVRVLIDEVEVLDSPVTLSLTSCTPDLTKTLLEGDGLQSGTAGCPATVTMAFTDQFHNVAVPGPSFNFGAAIVLRKDENEVAHRDKLASLPTYPFEGSWQEGDTGIFTLIYTPRQAGHSDLHLWCDPVGKGERIPFPGSPFALRVAEGPCSAHASFVDGWSKVIQDDKGDKNGKSVAQVPDDNSVLTASETISMRPQIFDQYSNPALLPEGVLTVTHILPGGMKTALAYTQQQRAGVHSYDIRHDVTIAGEHEVHICMHNEDIRGSPVTFSVQPSKPDASASKLLQPEDDKLYTGPAYKFVLCTFDKYENQCVRGGLQLSTRLQLIKQNSLDQTALVPSNHTCDWTDNSDGTYTIQISLAIKATVRLIVNMDKNLPPGAAELPPTSIQFHERAADSEGSPPAPTTTGAARLRAAATAVIAAASL